MGLGTFIASTLLERTGATLRFENRPAVHGGGARVTARWRNPTFRDTQ
jgi:two-component system sensor histidine kinase RegB